MLGVSTIAQMGLNGFRVEGLNFGSRIPTTMFRWWRQGLGEMGVGAGGGGCGGGGNGAGGEEDASKRV